MVGATSAVVLVLAVTAVTTTALLIQQGRTMSLLTMSREAEKREKLAANEHRAHAEHEAAISRAVNSFLDDLISSPDPAKQGRDIKVIDVLEGAMEKADARFADQPDVGAAVLLDVGRMYLSLGELDRAQEMMSHALHTLEKSLGPDDPDTVNAQSDLAAVLCEQGEYAAARDLLVPVLAKQAIDPGPKDPDTLTSVDVWMLVLSSLGRLQEAADVGRRNVALTSEVLGPEKPETLRRQSNLATVFMEMGNWKEAGDLLDSVVTVGRRALGRRDPIFLAGLQNLAVARRNLGQNEQAEALLREALEVDQEVLGPRHPQTLRGRHNLANLLFREGKKEEAERFARLAADMKAAFNEQFLNRELGQYDNGTQTSCVLPLAFGLVPKDMEQRIFDHLVNKIAGETKGHIGTGLIGGQYLNRVLSDRGRADLAYTMASQKDYPGWGYMVEHGATTIWELWNGNTADPVQVSVEASERTGKSQVTMTRDDCSTCGH